MYVFLLPYPDRATNTQWHLPSETKVTPPPDPVAQRHCSTIINCCGGLVLHGLCRSRNHPLLCLADQSTFCSASAPWHPAQEHKLNISFRFPPSRYLWEIGCDETPKLRTNTVDSTPTQQHKMVRPKPHTDNIQTPSNHGSLPQTPYTRSMRMARDAQGFMVKNPDSTANRGKMGTTYTGRHTKLRLEAKRKKKEQHTYYIQAMSRSRERPATLATRQ